MRIKYVGNYIDHIPQGKQRGIERIELSPEEIRENRSIFNLLNEKDMDILYLIFVSKKKQKAVQRILGRSQPSLCYDIRRIRERVQFIVYLKQVFDIFLDFLEYRGQDYDSVTTSVLILMYYTTSFTQSAEVLGCAQIQVRHTFEKALGLMRKNKHWDVYEIFKAISRNKNKIKRVYKDRKKLAKQP